MPRHWTEEEMLDVWNKMSQSGRDGHGSFENYKRLQGMYPKPDSLLIHQLEERINRLEAVVVALRKDT